MHKTRGWTSAGVALAIAALLLIELGPALAAGDQEEPEGHRGFMAAKGRVTYRVYCASCHGPNATGKGNLAQYLTVRPSDLTRLSQENGGEFPTSLIKQVIDGRRPVRGHGGQDMPIWGDVFQSSLSEEAPSGSETGEQRAQRKLDELVLYLETVQVKADDAQSDSEE